MELIFSPASPFVRKVNVLIHEVGLREQIKLSSVQTTALNTSPDARAANPLGKIPALILDDGRTLIDSRVICRFLNDLSDANLYPNDQLWEVLTLEALADGIMESGVSMVYEARLRPEAQQLPDWVAAQWSKISHALEALERRGFMAMDGDLNMGQLALGCALGYLDFRHNTRDWRSEKPELAGWYAAISSRPSMVATQPEN